MCYCGNACLYIRFVGRISHGWCSCAKFVQRIWKCVQPAGTAMCGTPFLLSSGLFMGLHGHIIAMHSLFLIPCSSTVAAAPRRPAVDYQEEDSPLHRNSGNRCCLLQDLYRYLDPLTLNQCGCTWTWSLPPLLLLTAAASAVQGMTVIDDDDTAVVRSPECFCVGTLCACMHVCSMCHQYSASGVESLPCRISANEWYNSLCIICTTSAPLAKQLL